jgi:periplasmic protein CpxP/Spy
MVFRVNTGVVGSFQLQVRLEFLMRITLTSIALSTVLAVGLSSAALAQDQAQPATGNPATSAVPQSPSSEAPHHRHGNPQHQAKVMAKKLGLSADQQANIEPILAERQQQLQSLRADATLAPQDRRAKALSINQASDAKLEALLNDQQKQQYEQMKQARRAKRMQRMQQSANSPSNS